MYFHFCLRMHTVHSDTAAAKKKNTAPNTVGVKAFKGDGIRSSYPSEKAAPPSSQQTQLTLGPWSPWSPCKTSRKTTVVSDSSWHRWHRKEATLSSSVRGKDQECLPPLSQIRDGILYLQVCKEKNKNLGGRHPHGVAPSLDPHRLRLGWGSRREKTSGSSVNLPWCMDLLRRVRVSTNTYNLLLIWLMLREEREEGSACVPLFTCFNSMSLWTNVAQPSVMTVVMMIWMLEHTFSPLGPDGPCRKKKTRQLLCS